MCIRDSLRPKYVSDFEIDSPYVLLEMEAQLYFFTVTGIVGFVVCLIGKLVLKKVKFFSRNYQEFFWNMPLRTFAEIYLEISILNALNSDNIGMIDPGLIILTIFLVVSFTFSIVFPFMQLNFIQSKYNKLSQDVFINKFGSVTEDIKVEGRFHIWSQAFYPLFTISRLAIA